MSRQPSTALTLTNTSGAINVHEADGKQEECQVVKSTASIITAIIIFYHLTNNLEQRNGSS